MGLDAPARCSLMPPMPILLHCTNARCMNFFGDHPYRANARFCSTACSGEGRRVPRIEQTCAAPDCEKAVFPTQKQYDNGDRKFCSAECGRKVQKVRTPTLVHCANMLCQCFYVALLPTDQKLSKFCSYTCAASRPRTCKECNRLFKPRTKKTLFCSRPCTVKHRVKLEAKRRVIRMRNRAQLCAQCKHAFVRKKRGQVFCSKPCSEQFRSYIAKHRRVPAGCVERNCTYCKKEFFPKKAAVDRGQGLFCSRSCKAKEMSPKTGFRRDPNTMERPCQHCGKAMVVSKWYAEVGRKMFCNRACYAESRKGQIPNGGWAARFRKRPEVVNAPPEGDILGELFAAVEA